MFYIVHCTVLQICGRLRQTAPVSVQQWRGSFVCDSLRPIQERLTAGSWDVWKSFIVRDSLIRCLMHSIGSVSSKIGKVVGPPNPHFCPDHWFAKVKTERQRGHIKRSTWLPTLGLFGNVSFALVICVSQAYFGILILSESNTSVLFSCKTFHSRMHKHCFANFLDKITVGGSSTADIPFYHV